MAKLTKRIRKGAARVARSKMTRDILEDLISAALIAAAARISSSRSVKKVVRDAGEAVKGEGDGERDRAKKRPVRRRKASGKKRAKPG